MEGRKSRRILIVTLVGLFIIIIALSSGILINYFKNSSGDGGDSSLSDEEILDLRETANVLIADGVEAEPLYSDIKQLYSDAENEVNNEVSKIEIRLDFVATLLDAELYSYALTELSNFENDFNNIDDTYEARLWRLYSIYYDAIGDSGKLDEYQQKINDYLGGK